MAAPPLLTIGGSAGSLPSLLALVAGLPAELEAAVLVCQHTSERGRSHLPDIVARRSRLPTSWAVDREPLRIGHIYVAPPGRHLLVHSDEVRLSDGPRVNRHRPSVDVLFASAAEAAGRETTAVVLSGVLDDGAVGAALVDLVGGQVWVEDPASAEFASMPQAALAAAPSARILTEQTILGDLLTGSAQRRHPAPTGVAATGTREEGNMAQQTPSEPGFLQAGESQLTRMACPECGGGLAQVDLPFISYFRWHVGHQYAPQSLAAAQAEASERKLWSAVAAMEEQAVMEEYLETTDDQADTERSSAGTFRSSARELASRAAALRQRVQQWTSGPDQAGSGGSG